MASTSAMKDMARDRCGVGCLREGGKSYKSGRWHKYFTSMIKEASRARQISDINPPTHVLNARDRERERAKSETNKSSNQFVYQPPLKPAHTARRSHSPLQPPINQSKQELDNNPPPSARGQQKHEHTKNLAPLRSAPRHRLAKLNALFFPPSPFPRT